MASRARTPFPIPGLPTAAPAAPPAQLETPPSSTDGARTSYLNAGSSKRKASPCTIHLSKRGRIWTSMGGSSVPIPVPPLSPGMGSSPPSRSAQAPTQPLVQIGDEESESDLESELESESDVMRKVIVELRSLKKKVETQTEVIMEQERRAELLKMETGRKLDEMMELLSQVREEESTREVRLAGKVDKLISWSARRYHLDERRRQRYSNEGQPPGGYRRAEGGSNSRELDPRMDGGSHLRATPSMALPSEEAEGLPCEGGRGGGSWLAEDMGMTRDKSIPLIPLSHSESHLDYALSDLDSISPRSLHSGVESLPPSCPQSPFRPHLAFPPPQFERSDSSSVPDVEPRDISENPQDQRAPGETGPDSDSGSVASEYASARSRTSTPVEVEVEPEELMRGVSVQSDLPELKPSDGKRKAGGVRWPKRGKNTRKGRMQVIDCDMCRGRVHWACASLGDNDDMTNVHWCCPDCEDFLAAEDSDSDGSPGRVALAETTERCLRPDCILRGKQKKVASKRGDDDLFIIERVIGRKKVGQRVNGAKIYEYLVKWENWEIYDATWQEAKDLPNPTRWEELFVSECKRRDVDFRWKVALLPEASEWWDEDGRLMMRKLEEAGVEPRIWWS